MLRFSSSVALGALALFLAGGCSSPSSGGKDSTPTPTPTPGVEPTPFPELTAPLMRRLLERQYVNSIEDLLGPEAAAAAKPPEDIASGGLAAVGASEIAISGLAVEEYEQSARDVAAAARAAGAFEGECSSTVDACLRAFVADFGRRAWRRPWTQEEIDEWAGAAIAAKGEVLPDTKEFVASAILQSPTFLYQVEIGSPSHKESARKLSGLEVATRLSFFLNDTTPSPELLAAAEAGALDTAAGVRAAAAEALARPEAREALRAFYGEHFGVQLVGRLAKDPDRFPQWNAALAASMQEEAYRLLDDVVWERDVDWKDLLSADYTFVDPELARVYELNPPADGFVETLVPAAQRRAGILTQPAMMAIFAHPSTTSPTRRGKFVQERLLCSAVEPPPPDVDTTVPPDPPDGPQTMRQKLEEHLTNDSCAACHVRLDMIGFGLEHFDAIGQWRPNDQGLTIDDDGEIPGVGTFDGAQGLAELLRGDPRVDACLVRAIFRQGTGHLENDEEEAALEALEYAFVSNGSRIEGLLLDFVSSDLFRYVGVRPGTEGVFP